MSRPRYVRPNGGARRPFRPQGPAHAAALNRVRAGLASQYNRRRAAVRRVALTRGLKPETKTFDPVVLDTNLLYADSSTAVAVSASGYITTASSAMVLNQVPQDATSTGRVGRRLTMKAIHLRGKIVAPTLAGQNSGLVRLALVYIPQMDRTVTTMPPQTAIWTLQRPESLRVLNNASRFRILRQWTYRIAGDSDTPTTGLEVHELDEMVKLNLDTTWTQANTTGSFDAMEEGGLCLYAQGDMTAGATSSTIVAFVARLYFHDK